MYKVNLPADFNGTRSQVLIFIGNPQQGKHPIQFQADWLSKERGGSIPQEIMESLMELKELADRNNLPFEDLCAYALEAAVAENPKQQPESTDSSAPTEIKVTN